MENERFLHHKLSKLHVQLSDFHNRISPTKGESGKRAVESTASKKWHQDRSATEHPEVEPSKLLFILKPLICILCPFLFPTLVYSIGGYGTLFWISTAVSPFAYFLSLMVFSFLGYKMHEGMQFKLLRGVQNKVKIIIQDVDNNIGGNRKCLYALTLSLLVIFGFGYWAHLSNMPTLLNICNTLGSYVAGILTVNVYAFWKQPKRLPYLSPLSLTKKQEKVASPSSKRGLNFYEMPAKCSPLLNPQNCYRSLTAEGSICPKLQAVVPSQSL